MKYFERNFKGLVNLCFADVICCLEQRNGAPHSYGKVSFAQQNAGIFTSTLGQSFGGSLRCAGTFKREHRVVCVMRKARRANEQAAIFRSSAPAVFVATCFPCQPGCHGVSAHAGLESIRLSWLAPRPHAFLAVVALYCFDGDDTMDIAGALGVSYRMRTTEKWRDKLAKDKNDGV